MLGPYELNSTITGDCLSAMKKLPDNCIDTVLTDPPYGLKFMGKNWDYGLPGEVYWRECLRIAKPGATLIAFGGSRTYHRLTCAIEDAGWEIRDCISYFHDGTQQERAFMASLSEEQLAAYLELHRPGQTMCWVYGQGFAKGANVNKKIDEAAGAEREVIRTEKFRDIRNGHGRGYGDGINASARDKPEYLQHPITAPATPLACDFDGWHSNLKPSVEFIVVAMKPLDGTYANNAKVWGVAGLDIESCRVGTESRPKIILDAKETNGNTYAGRINGSLAGGSKVVGTTTQGRYPANLIHDSSPQVLAEFDKAGVRTSGNKTIQRQAGIWSKDRVDLPVINDNGGDSGSAARFFQSCPLDADDPNPCLTCQDCVAEDEAEAPKGRYPANLIWDGSDEVSREFDKAGVRVAGAKPAKATKPDGFFIGKDHKNLDGIRVKYDSGSAARFFTQCLPDSEPSQHPDDPHSIPDDTLAEAIIESVERYQAGQPPISYEAMRQKLYGDSEAVRFRYCPKASSRERGESNNHPTVKPLSLMRYLARLTKTPYGGVVLDPFAGSGTTGLACLYEGRNFILIEKEPKYVEICRHRIAKYTGQEIMPVKRETEKETIEQLSLW